MGLMDKRDVDFGFLRSLGVTPRKLEKGEALFEQGDAGKDMFLVQSGRVGILANGVQVEEVGPGGIFGEMSLIDGSARSASVVGLEPSEILPINERSFVYLVHETPYFALDVMRTLAARIRRMNERLGRS